MKKRQLQTSVLFLLLFMTATSSVKAQEVNILGEDEENWQLKKNGTKTTLEYKGDKRVKSVTVLPEFVDLGIDGIWWTTKNVGAKTPWTYGSYFAWGEIETKTSYSWDTYLYDKNDAAVSAYDAARYASGGKYETPSQSDFQKLYNECYWVWTDDYFGKGVEGYIVYKSHDKTKDKQLTNNSGDTYSLIQDTHIFLPAAGYYYNDVLFEEKTIGWYWTNTLTAEQSDRAYNLKTTNPDSDDSYLYNGFPVRGVLKSISLSHSTALIYVNSIKRLHANTYPEGQSITWSTSDAETVSVNTDGVITGVKEGTATITATLADGHRVTCEVTVENGLLPGIFSVSENKKVQFTKGNLQYNHTKDDWRFAKKQSEMCHKWDDIVGDYYSKWINKWTDFFGWGTWLEGGEPTNINQVSSQYTWDDSKNSVIGPGWLTLSQEEWDYLINKRTNATNLRAWKDGGMVFLPDNSTNSFNEDLSVLEEAGAVYLPASGRRPGDNGEVRAIGNGYYWSSTAVDANNAYAFWSESRPFIDPKNKRDRFQGHCVRLVRVKQ